MKKLVIAIALSLVPVVSNAAAIACYDTQTKEFCSFPPCSGGCEPGFPQGRWIGEDVPNNASELFVITKARTYRFRWDPMVCNYAKTDAFTAAQSRCQEFGYKSTSLHRLLEDFCSYPLTIDITERFSGVFTCGD